MPSATGADLHSRGEGLAWSYELDLGQLLAAIGVSQPGAADDEQAAAEEAAALDQGAARDLTGVVADQLPAGPALAGWVSGTDVRALPEFDLPGVASAFRRVAAWAQARELEAVAEMASRAAQRDDHVRVDEDGRPGQVTPAAASTVGLELVMAHPTAMDWTSLAVTLRWRLPATWAALHAGTIDLYRARLIADATSPLDDDTARAVEARILPGAGDQTTGQLRAALRRAVIAADPEGAEQRRKEAQRHAKVSLYPDPATGTATLTGTRLPSVHAAAALARLTAIARAMKSAGMTGGLDYLRANALIGLLLGTLQLVPPPDGDPGPSGPTDPDPGPSPSDPGYPDPGDTGPSDPGSGDPGPGDTGSGDPGPGDTGPSDPGPGPGGSGPTGFDAGDAGLRDSYGWDDADWDDGAFSPEPPAAWPPLPATSTQTPPFLGQPPPRGQPPSATRPRRRQLTRPPPGQLELVISWRAITGDPAGPATLNRVGPITAGQALPLALTAPAGWSSSPTRTDMPSRSRPSAATGRAGPAVRPA